MATSGYFDTDSVGNFYFTFEWWRTGYNSSANEHYISYKVTAHNSAGNYRTVYERNLWVNGSQRFYEDWGERFYDGDVVTEGNITVASSNSAGDGSFNASFEAGVGITPGTNCSGNGSWDLDRIPRYTSVWNSERGKTINTISVNWSTSDKRDWTQYSLNDGGWQDAYDTVAWDGKSGYYTISNLQPNTTYKVRTRCRREDSGLWSEADNIWITTNQISIVYGTNFNLGDNESITYSNPRDGSIIKTAIYLSDGATCLASYRDVTGESYTFQFTDEELDRIYRQFGNSNSIVVRIYNMTICNGVTYWDYSQKTCTLTGNQKNVKTKVSNSWRRAKIWIKVSGSWKRAVVWTKANGTWKRSI